MKIHMLSLFFMIASLTLVNCKNDTSKDDTLVYINYNSPRGNNEFKLRLYKYSEGTLARLEIADEPACPLINTLTAARFDNLETIIAGATLDQTRTLFLPQDDTLYTETSDGKGFLFLLEPVAGHDNVVMDEKSALAVRQAANSIMSEVRDGGACDGPVPIDAAP